MATLVPSFILSEVQRPVWNSTQRGPPLGIRKQPGIQNTQELPWGYTPFQGRPKPQTEQDSPQLRSHGLGELGRGPGRGKRAPAAVLRAHEVLLLLPLLGTARAEPSRKGNYKSAFRTWYKPWTYSPKWPLSKVTDKVLIQSFPFKRSSKCVYAELSLLPPRTSPFQRPAGPPGCLFTHHFPRGFVVRPTQAKWNHSMEHCCDGEQSVKERFSFEIIASGLLKLPNTWSQTPIYLAATGECRLTPNLHIIASKENSPPSLLTVGTRKQPVTLRKTLNKEALNRSLQVTPLPSKLLEVSPLVTACCVHLSRTKLPVQDPPHSLLPHFYQAQALTSGLSQPIISP